MHNTRTRSVFPLPSLKREGVERPGGFVVPGFGMAAPSHRRDGTDKPAKSSAADVDVRLDCGIAFCQTSAVPVMTSSHVRDFFIEAVDKALRHDTQITVFGLVVAGPVDVVSIASAVRARAYRALRSCHAALNQGEHVMASAMRTELYALSIEASCWIDECIRLDDGRGSSFLGMAHDILLNLSRNPDLSEFFFPTNGNIPHFEV